MLKYEFTFSEVLCTEQIPGFSDKDYTFWLQRKCLEGIETSLETFFNSLLDIYLQKWVHIHKKRSSSS